MYSQFMMHGQRKH